MRLFPWRKPKPPPEEVMRGLREQALDRSAEQLGLAPTPTLPHVFGILMETGYENTVASLVAFADGSASLYLSSGGGVIGAGQHVTVRATLQPFFLAAEKQINGFTPATETPHPKRGRVRFYVRTFQGTITAEADEQDLGNMRHELSPVFHAGHAVIAAIREASGG